MRVSALFAGIGGLELGLLAGGHETTLTCEVAPTAAAVLAARFPAVRHHSDVRTLEGLPDDTELLTAGFPCQDLSQAGRTRGIGGDRSGLVEHVFRLVDRTSVPLVLLENVPFMLSLDKGTAMRRLTDAFESRGFRWAYRVVNTLSWLPQRRERVFFLASRGEIDPQDVLLADEASPPSREASLSTHAFGFYWTEGRGGLGWAPDAVPPLKNGSTIGIPSPPAILLPDGRLIKPDIRDAERLQGFPSDWTLPADGVAKRSRWQLVGNAVSVPAAAWIGRRLATPGRFDEARRGGPIDESRRWPRAAHGAAGRRFSCLISDHPEWAPRPALHLFLEHPGELLSWKATRGFLQRTRTANLRFAPGFIDRVESHLHRMEQQGKAAA